MVSDPVTVTFMVDESEYSSKEIDVGRTIETLPTNPSKTGCTFIGWFDSITEGTQYTEESVINANTVLYARFNVTLILNTNEGVFENDQTTKTITGIYGEEVEIPMVTKSGYRLNGWYTATNGGTQKYNCDNKIILHSGGNLYAQWRKKCSDYLGDPINIQEYGRKVEGISSDKYSGNWRLFYQDSENTYIIADTTNSKYYLSNYYRYYSKISEIGKNLNSKMGTSGVSYDNSRAAAFLTDSNNSLWNDYKDNSLNSIINYVIGSPSLELFFESYNATHTETILEI